MNAHLAATAELLNEAGIDAYDTTSDRPDCDPSDWAGTWTPTQREAWELTFPHVILSMPTPREVALSLSRGSLDIDEYVTVTYVGDSVRGARWIGDKSRLALDRARVVTGEYAGLLTLGPTNDVAVDRDISYPGIGNPYFGTDIYHYRATPAPSGS